MCSNKAHGTRPHRQRVKRRTTVLSAESRPRSDDNDRDVAHYRLVWRADDGKQHASTFKRAGPVRHEAGETWELWVSPARDEAHDDPPWVSWLWLGFGIPISSLAIGWLWQWRSRVLARSMLRGIEAREERRTRRAAARGTDEARSPSNNPPPVSEP